VADAARGRFSRAAADSPTPSTTPDAERRRFPGFESHSFLIGDRTAGEYSRASLIGGDFGDVRRRLCFLISDCARKELTMKWFPSMVRTAGFAACTLAAVSLAAAQQNQPEPRSPRDAQNNRQDTQNRQDAQQNDQQNNQQNDRDAQPRAGAETEAQPRVQLGVRISESPTTGVFVADVAPGSTAQRNGILRGDYILSLNGKTIASPDELTQTLASVQPGQKAQIVIWRNQTRWTMSISFPETRVAGFRGAGPGAAGQLGEARAWLGVQVAGAEATPGAKGQPAGREAEGARVVGVYPSGPASLAGLEQGDQIVMIGETKIATPNDVTTAIRSMKPRQEVKIQVLRDGEQQTLAATLGNFNDFFPAGSAPQRSGNQRQAQFRGDFQGASGIPAHSMMLEQHRRFAQQHQRIEKLVLELKKEIQELRAELRGANGRAPDRAAPKREIRPEPKRERSERDVPKVRKPERKEE
jgi:type II secretory pathway component PulC